MRDIPFTAIDDADFRAFTESLSSKFHVPGRTAVPAIIDRVYDHMEDTVLAALQRAKHISLTCDAATTVAQDSMHAVTAHFITDDWEMVSCVIALDRLDSSHTGIFLKGVVENVIKEVGIAGKITCLTTDGGMYRSSSCLSSTFTSPNPPHPLFTHSRSCQRAEVCARA